MGQIKNSVIEISNWLNSERNYDDGVFLYNRYGNNTALKRMFPGREKFYAAKLAYELGKLIGIGFEKFNRSDGILNQTDPPAHFATGDVHRSNDAVIASGGTPMKQVFGVGGFPVYPPVVNRVIFEMSRLYNERAMLKAQQNSVSDENTADNVAKRKEIVGLVESVSVRLNVLFQAKKAFLAEGTLPDELELFPEPGMEMKTEQTEEELLKLRNTLRSSITRAKNMLEYQSQKKEQKANPMPDCPKRTEIEVRLKEKDLQLCDVEEKLKKYVV